MHGQFCPEKLDIGENVMSYRVVYGETMPAWEKIFDTKREAEEFAKKHRSFGDVIFSIRKVVSGEKPQSMVAAISCASVA